MHEEISGYNFVDLSCDTWNVLEARSRWLNLNSVEACDEVRNVTFTILTRVLFIFALFYFFFCIIFLMRFMKIIEPAGQTDVIARLWGQYW